MLRGEHALCVVVGRLELDALLGDLGQVEQAHHLEAAAVGQEGAVPAHELVQPARLAQGLDAGPGGISLGIKVDIVCLNDQGPC